MVASKSYYYALRNQFSLINTQISKLLYCLVFHLSWMYFLYVYICHIFAVDGMINQAANDWVKWFLNTTEAKKDESDGYFKQEQFISFILTTFLIIENKIIETVGHHLEKLGETNPDEIDTEKCAERMLAHLELYAKSRQLREMEIKKTSKEKDKKEESIEILSEKVESLRKDLNSKIAQSQLNQKFVELMDKETELRLTNEEILKKASNSESLEFLPSNYNIKLYLNEKTSYTEKIIFFNFIKKQFSYAQIYFAFLYQMQRIGLIFLMTVATFSPTIPNILMTLVIFFMELRNKGYADKISTLCLVACFLVLKDDVLLMISQMNWLEKNSFDIANNYKNDRSIYRFILNYDSKVIWFSTIFLFFSNLFVLITIAISKSVLITINSYKFPKNKIFWFYQQGKVKKSKRSKLVVDHKQWAGTENSVLLTVRELVFIYPLELYLIVMTLITIVLSQETTTVLAAFIIIPYILSLIEFKDKEMRKKVEEWYFFGFVLLCWLFLLVSPSLTMLVLSKDVKTWANLKADVALPLIILLNKTFNDFLSMDDYIENQSKLKKNKILLSSLINYCYTYEYNESKFRENLNIFMKQSHVIECTEKISTDNNSGLQVELVEDLFKYDDELLSIILTKSNRWEAFKMKFFMFLYQFMLSLNFKELFESVFYLYSTFKRKNRKVINNESELNLNDFLRLESDVMIKSIKTTEQYYEKLREKDQEKLGEFDDVFKKIEQLIKDMEMREKIKQEKISKQKIEEQAFAAMEKEAEQLQAASSKQRTDISHSLATDILLQYINQPGKIKKNDDDNFIFNLRTNEDLVFTNIQPYFVEQTDCFTKFDYLVLIKLFLGIFISNLDMIIIILMAAIHIWAGGIYGALTLTIVFFILIEERSGKFQLWVVLAVIYFLVLLGLLALDLMLNFIPATSNENKAKYKLPTELTTELVLFIVGKIDSKYGICLVFFLIILLRINFEKLGFYNKDILSVENLPMAVHRVDSF